MKREPSHTVFVVVHSAWQAEILTRQLAATGEVGLQFFSTSQACLAALKGDASEVVLLVLAADIPDAPLLVQTARLCKSTLPIVVIVQSAASEISASSLMMAGANEKLAFGSRAAERIQVLAEAQYQTSTAPTRRPLRGAHRLLGISAPMQVVFQLVQKAALADITVVLRGETGTGKEEVARAIHRVSPRADGPFVALNMAAIPRELLESELFGHEKGAFTSAISQRIGLIEQANKGTLFLDEIADLELGLQAKLLRVLQERMLVRVGGKQLIPFDVRLIVASHSDLASHMREGSFREDLYYRLLGLPIALPPLRERGEDILLLAYHFLNEQTSTANNRKTRFSQDAEQKLLRYKYPGNVRELRAIVELATVLSNGEQIEAEEIVFHDGIEHHPVTEAFDLTLREHTIKIVQQYLDHYRGNVVLAASRLGVGKSTLYRMIKSGELHTRFPIGD